MAANLSNVLGADLWFRVSRRGNCKALAVTARRLLDIKSEGHKLVGKAAVWAMDKVGFGKVEQTVGRELVKRIPLPWDAKLAAAAHALRVIGVWICLPGDIGRCPCLADLVKDWSVDRLREALNWKPWDVRGFEQATAED